MKVIVNEEYARDILGKNFIGEKESEILPEGFKIKTNTSLKIPFSLDELKNKKDSHILIYCPAEFEDGTPISIYSIRTAIEKIGVKSPCFYNQDWYLKENFYKKAIDAPHWLLIQKYLDDSTRGVAPEKLESEYKLPAAVELTFSFFVYYYVTGGQKLWNNDYVWCKDKDNSGDRVYVGRYTDLAGLNAEGFEIHRHLSIKMNYGALS